MKFILYKFSQSPIITFITVVCTAFMMLFVGLNLNVIVSIILSLLMFLVIFIPIISIFYPIIFIGYSIAGILTVQDSPQVYSIALVALMILNILRFGYMFLFVIKNTCYPNMFVLEK